jgi:molybdopterin synthase catalytic subunit
MGVRIQTEDFNVSDEIKALSQGKVGAIPGAVATFTGLVRDRHHDKTITAITLEHYPGMTEKEMGRIRDEAMTRWPLSQAVVIHRVGRLLPADQIVFVGCASSHRKAAFDAVCFIMDFLKTDAPFWKAEEIDGGVNWVDARTSDNLAAARWAKDSD